MQLLLKSGKARSKLCFWVVQNPEKYILQASSLKKHLTSIPSQKCSWFAKVLGTNFHCLDCKLFRTHDYVKNKSLARHKSRKYHFTLIWDTERRKGHSCAPLEQIFFRGVFSTEIDDPCKRQKFMEVGTRRMAGVPEGCPVFLHLELL